MTVYYYILIPIAYLLLGVGWGFIRWKRFVDSEVEFYESERQRFLNHHRIRGGQIPDFLVFEWRHFVQATERLRVCPPKAHEYQGQIFFDVALWWLSIIFVVVSQTVSAAMHFIMREYNKITQQKIDRIKQDLKG
jgi:hypothetical protein